MLGTHFLAVLCLLKEAGMNFEVCAYCHSEPADYTKDIVKRSGFYLGKGLSGGVDVLIHAAGYAQPSVFTADPIRTIELNTTMTRQLFNFLDLDGKFLFTSSSEVYSGLSGLVNESNIGTTTPLHPRACYIEGKRCGETIVNAYRQSRIDAKSVRLGLTYGPGTRKHDKRAMSTFIEQALTTNKLELNYSGVEPRAFCYVSDAVEMMFQVLLHGKHPVYNVSSKSFSNMASIAHEIAFSTGADLIVPIDKPEILGSPQTVELDMTRIEMEFHKKDFIGLEEGLERTIAWQRGLYQ
jgi:UDP-glucuronate decarboxylase